MSPGEMLALANHPLRLMFFLIISVMLRNLFAFWVPQSKKKKKLLFSIIDFSEHVAHNITRDEIQKYQYRNPCKFYLILIYPARWWEMYSYSSVLTNEKTAGHSTKQPKVTQPMKGRKVLVAQSCPVLCKTSPGKNTGVVSHSLLQGIFLTQGPTHISCTAGGFFTIWATREA